MKKSLLILLSILVTAIGMANNTAVLIGISSYPESSGWRALSSDNDVRILRNCFPSSWKVIVLEDSEATKASILNSLSHLKVSPGDTVFVHFSGHGQQMLPIVDADEEIDSLDEALIPYDARKEWSSDYKGENHLRDNELSECVERIRNTVGKGGLVIVSLDACHSDSMDRGEPDSTNIIYRGTSGIFGELVTDDNIKNRFKRDTTIIPIKNNSQVIYLSACRSHSKNSEITVNGTGFGSLSYAVSVALGKVGLTDSKAFLDHVVAVMNEVVPFQTPGIRASFKYDLPYNEVQDSKDDLIADDSHQKPLYLIFSLIALFIALFIWILTRKHR